MALMTKLKVTAEKRGTDAVTEEAALRARLLAQLAEQLAIVKAEEAGESYVKTREVYVTDEDGARILKTITQRVRKWYWRNVDDVWFMELRYGNRALLIDGENTAIEVGAFSKLTQTLETVTKAVKAGELDNALKAAKKERTAMLRKAK